MKLRIVGMVCISLLMAGCGKEAPTALDEASNYVGSSAVAPALKPAAVLPGATDVSGLSADELAALQAVQKPVAAAKQLVPLSVSGNIQLGAWFPYVSNNGVPPIASFAARGIDVTFISGDLDAAALAAHDVIFIGRAGMIGNFPSGAGVIQDINAVIAWIDDGGVLIGESNALLYDSDFWRSTTWSSELSVVAGISAPQRGTDVGRSNLPVVITDLGHPITQGVSASFTLSGTQAHMDGTVLDTGKNPSVVGVALVRGEPVSVAQFGSGCVVNFPTAVGFGGMDWSTNLDYETLFINAVEFCVSSGDPQTKDECKKGGWEQFGFKNQGQCVRFIETGKDSR